MLKIKKKKLNIPELSIIIPVHNALPYVDKCLASLQFIKDVSYEIIIVDDNSDPETKNYLKRFPQLNVIYTNKQEGFIESCHLGIKRSTAKHILFLNSDTELLEPKSFRH